MPTVTRAQVAGWRRFPIGWFVAAFPPDDGWTKADIIYWLTRHGIAHDPSALKADLLALVPAKNPLWERP